MCGETSMITSGRTYNKEMKTKNGFTPRKEKAHREVVETMAELTSMLEDQLMQVR